MESQNLVLLEAIFPWIFRSREIFIPSPFILFDEIHGHHKICAYNIPKYIKIKVFNLFVRARKWFLESSQRFLSNFTLSLHDLTDYLETDGLSNAVFYGNLRTFKCRLQELKISIINGKTVYSESLFKNCCIFHRIIETLEICKGFDSTGLMLRLICVYLRANTVQPLSNRHPWESIKLALEEKWPLQRLNIL